MSGSSIVGLASDCDVRIDDQYVSAHHARVDVDDVGAVWVRDLGSTNGTYIQRGKTRIKVHGPTRMYVGDVLWLGGRTCIPWNR